MELQDDDQPTSSAAAPQQKAQSRRVMIANKECGTSNSMSTITLQQQTATSTTTTTTMNDAKEMSRPASGNLLSVAATTADKDCAAEPAAKRLRVVHRQTDGLDAAAAVIKPASSAQVVAPSSSKRKTPPPPASCSTFDGTTTTTMTNSRSNSNITTSPPAARVTSASEGSSTSGSSLEAHRHDTAAKTATPATVACNAGNGAAKSSSPPTPSAATQDASTTAVEDPSTTSNKSTTSKTALHSAKADSPPLPPPPIKSLTMLHLDQKYTAELEYMLREFRKLERQLLGAKAGGGSGTGAATSSVQENKGSRERREKLHSFILHLENTLQQIQLGVRLEAEGKSTVMVGVTVGEVMGGTATAATGSGSTATSSSSTNKPTETLQDKQQLLADSGALATLTKEKEEEENVQKLEEHILANLLPVKVRLKKQLAAQQGASRNPVGMPAARRGMLSSSTSVDKKGGTFAAAAEQKRKRAAEAAAAAAEVRPHERQQSGGDTQFGKPIIGGASSLTQKLHGPTLGSSSRKHGHGVGSAEPPTTTATTTDSDKADAAAPADVNGETPEGTERKRRKIFYAGMAPGSTQLKSGVSAASGAHKMIIETPSLMPKPSKAQVPEPTPSSSARMTTKPCAAMPQHSKQVSSISQSAPCHPAQKMAAAATAATRQPPATSSIATSSSKDQKHEDSALTEEQKKKKLRKLKKKKKQLKLARTRERERERHLHVLRQQQTMQVAPPKPAPGRKGKTAAKSQGKKKGPRSVEYICALCSEAYSSTCDCNPWWALTHHDCPKCRKAQIPRVDITAPANAIEYHPALLAHAEEGGSGAGAGGPVTNGPGVMHINPSHIPSSATFPMAPRRYPTMLSDVDSHSDLSDISDGDLSDDSLDSLDLDLECMRGLSPAEQAENEQFGLEYEGPKLDDKDTARLLVLMSHASTCPGRHKSAKHRDVCNSVKYMMLHVRDCPGTTATFDVCPFPWCRKVKHLLYHLVSCTRPKECTICTPKGLSPNLAALVGLNAHRRKKQRERRAAAMAAASAAAKAKPSPARAMAKSGKPTTVPKGPYRPVQAASTSRATSANTSSTHRLTPSTATSGMATSITSDKKAAATAAAIAAVASAVTKPATSQSKPVSSSSPKPSTAAPATKLPVATKLHCSKLSAGGAAIGTTALSSQTATSVTAPEVPDVAPQKVRAPEAAEVTKMQPEADGSVIDTSLAVKTDSVTPIVSGKTTTANVVHHTEAASVLNKASTTPPNEDNVTVEAETRTAVTVATKAVTDVGSVASSVQIVDVPESIEPSDESSALTTTQVKAAGATTLVQEKKTNDVDEIEVKSSDENAATTTASLAQVGSVDSAALDHGSAGDDHDETNCPDECCAASRAFIDDSKNPMNSRIGTEPLATTPEDKCRSPAESADLSHSSSCSEEVPTKKADVVRISSC